MIRPESGPVFHQGQECWARWGGFQTHVGMVYRERLVVIERIDSEGIHVRTLDHDDGDSATATFDLRGEAEVGEDKVILVPVINLGT